MLWRYFLRSFGFWRDLVLKPYDDADRVRSFVSCVIAFVVVVALISGLPLAKDPLLSALILLLVGVVSHLLSAFANWGQDLGNINHFVAYTLGYLGWWGMVMMLATAFLILLISWILAPILGV